MPKYNWTRINCDSNGNPRHVIHFLECAPPAFADMPLVHMYAATVKLVNKIHGRKFHNKQYGGGIVFCTYDLDRIEAEIDRLKGGK